MSVVVVVVVVVALLFDISIEVLPRKEKRDPPSMGTGLPTSASKDPKSSVTTPNSGDLSMLRTVQVIIPGTSARSKILN